MQVVNGVEHGAQHLTASVQVVQVGATEAATTRAVVSFESVTGVTSTSLIEWSMIGFVTRIANF